MFIGSLFNAGKFQRKIFHKMFIISTYDPQESETREFTRKVADQVREKIRGAVSVKLLYGMPRPKAHLGTGRNEGKVKESAPAFHLGKPDIDNLNKFALDSLTKAGVWEDDSRIIRVDGEKVYIAPNETPFTWVAVKGMNGKRPGLRGFFERISAKNGGS